MAKKQGYKVVSYNEDKAGIRTAATTLHTLDSPEWIEQVFKDYTTVREITVKTAPRSDSFTRRVHIYTKKGR